MIKYESVEKLGQVKTLSSKWRSTTIKSEVIEIDKSDSIAICIDYKYSQPKIRFEKAEASNIDD